MHTFPYEIGVRMCRRGTKRDKNTSEEREDINSKSKGGGDLSQIEIDLVRGPKDKGDSLMTFNKGIKDKIKTCGPRKGDGILFPLH